MLSCADLCSDLSTNSRGEADNPALCAVSELDAGGDFVHADFKSLALLLLSPLHAPLDSATVGAVQGLVVWGSLCVGKAAM